MHDESECGYGAVVESRDKDWLRVGALIGIKSRDAETWQVGIIRRLSRVNSDTSSVGIETLPEQASLTLLYDTNTSGYVVSSQDQSSTNLPHACLLLTGSDRSRSVILDPVHYLPNKVCQVHGGPNQELITLGTPIEHSEGWIRVAIDPISD